jgi:acyl carrier protein
MTTAELKATVIDAFSNVAPEADVASIHSAENFRDQFEIDSVDFLNFVLALEQRLGIKVPEVDYPKLSSLDGCLAYLEGLL